MRSQRIALLLALCASGPAWGQSAPVTGGATASSAEVTAGNRFNPDISVIVEGNTYHDSDDGDAAGLAGKAAGINHAHGGHGHDHGGSQPGFNLQPAELFFSASVDPYFDTFVQAVIAEDGSVGLEEAYFTTRALPAGLRVKGGKFLSGIGYHNAKHRHQWPYMEQNLPYRHLLGAHGLMGRGVQATWTPATPVYTRFGVEALQGDQEMVGRFDDAETLHELEGEGAIAAGELDAYGEAPAGPRLFTAFAKLAPNLGYSHELQIGLFGVFADEQQEVHASTDQDERSFADGNAADGDHVLTGDYWVAGTDWVYSYDAAAQYGVGDFRLQAEYLVARKDLEVAYHDSKPGVIGDKRDFTQDGYYVQARYGMAANWQLGARYDTVGLLNEKETPAATEEYGRSERVSAHLTWTPSHFSRIRAQWSRARIAVDGGGHQRANQYYLRYILSMGQHGAHDF
jgi:hypothetical protein